MHIHLPRNQIRHHAHEDALLIVFKQLVKAAARFAHIKLNVDVACSVIT